MLCKINPTLGGATDEKARAINFLRAIEAICTAAAGSTPSVASLTTPTATPTIGVSGSVDIITEVISNAEAGGWTSSASTNVISNYNASLGSPYTVDLYRDSGKSVFPYRKLSFRTNPGNNFNASYTTYPYIVCSHGFNTEINASGSYLLGTNMSVPTTNGGLNPLLYKFDVNGSASTAGASVFRPAAGEWLIASTGDYFIALSGEFGTTGNPGNLIYAGLRSVSGWEDQYNDNPPLCSVVYDGSNQYTLGSGSNASMFARTFNSSGVQNSGPAWYRIDNSAANAFTGVADGSGIDPLSGWSNAQASLSNDAFFWGNQLQVPMCGGQTGLFKSKRMSVSLTGPVGDPVTGLLVPPAYPITFARHKAASTNPGGQAIGIYKSLGGTSSFIELYCAPGQSFVINNENYYSYSIGSSGDFRDLFLIRKY